MQFSELGVPIGSFGHLECALLQCSLCQAALKEHSQGPTGSEYNIMGGYGNVTVELPDTIHGACYQRVWLSERSFVCYNVYLFYRTFSTLFI